MERGEQSLSLQSRHLSKPHTKNSQSGAAQASSDDDDGLTGKGRADPQTPVLSQAQLRPLVSPEPGMLGDARRESNGDFAAGRARRGSHGKRLKS